MINVEIDTVNDEKRSNDPAGTKTNDDSVFDGKICEEQSDIGPEGQTTQLETESLENWRGLGKAKCGRKRKNTYLNPQSDWCAVSLSHTRKVLKIGLLKNGHRPELKPVKIGHENYVLSNTCAFDSFAQVMCVAYCDSDNVRNWFGTVNNKFTELVCNIVSHGVTTSAYKVRADILRLVFDTEVLPHGVCTINVTCSVSSLVSEVWLPAVFLEISQCSSAVCPSKIRTNSKYLPFNSSDLKHWHSLKKQYKDQ